jgi:hypothetical protein
MELLSLTRLDGPGNTLALACVQVTPDIRVNGLRLVRATNGDMRIYSPNANGISALSFAPGAIAELKQIIIDAYGSETANERHR